MVLLVGSAAVLSGPTTFRPILFSSTSFQQVLFGPPRSHSFPFGYTTLVDKCVCVCVRGGGSGLP